VVAGLSLVAQSPVTRPLITEKVDENQLVTLKGNTHPAASAENDRGRVNPSLPMTGMILVLRRSPEQQAAFDSFVASQYDATSPNYHRWLEPEEVGERFGPALADIASVSSWLASHGLLVDGVSKDRMTIRFSGRAAQVQEAFHTEIHNLQFKGESHISNMTDPQIPMALEPVVLGPKALHNFIPRPLHRTGAAVRLNQETGKWERTRAAMASNNKVRADIGFVGGSGSNTYTIEDVAPYDFATMYNVLPLWNAATPIDGTGQTIAIAARSDVRASDVAKFRGTFGLTGGAFNTIHNGATDPGYCTGSSGNCTLDDQIENALDVEWSGAVAKGATIDLVVTAQTNANDAIFDSAQYVIDNKTASIINVSYGECELYLGTGGNTAYTGLWQTASTQGIAVFVATGDSGSPSCDQGGDSAGTPYSAHYGLTVSGIASTAFNTAVGGTDLNWGSSTSPYWSAANAPNGSTAAGYIPETPWNDSCTNPLLLPYFQSAATFLNNQGVSVLSPTNAESACNLVKNYWNQVNVLAGVDLSFFLDTVGASGGASNCTSSNGSAVSTCTGGYTKPGWQAGVTGIPSDNKRHIPDVSFFAGNGLFGSAYVICVSDTGTCLSSATSTTEPSGQEIGGTSVGSPAMAGVMALINQKAGSPQGNPNSALYVLAGKQNYASCSAETVGAASSSCYFNDIDTGTIAMPCAPGSPNCTLSTSGDTVGVLSGSSSATGYDEATGLGSLNVANVVNSFAASSTGTSTATVTVAASPSSFTTAQGTTVTVTVTGASGTPTGTVQLSSGTFISASRTLANGTYTFSLSPGLLAVGTDTITATYSGDATYATASGTTTVTITQAVLIAPTVTVTPASSSVEAGQSLNVTAAVTGTGPQPTGTVTLSGGGYTSPAQTLVGGSYTFVIPANSLSLGTDTLTVSYSGDGSYSSGAGSATVTVTGPAFALAATTPAAINKGGTATSTITATSSTGYSGTITLTCALTTSPTAAANLPTCSTAGGSTITMAAGTASGSGSAKVTTTGTTAAMTRPPIGGWAEAGSGAVLALLVFFGIPARRRGWRAILGAFVLLATLGSLAACGGGGSKSGGGGTTAGSYVFTVTGTGDDPAKATHTTTFTVVVN